VQARPVEKASTIFGNLKKIENAKSSISRRVRRAAALEVVHGPLGGAGAGRDSQQLDLWTRRAREERGCREHTAGFDYVETLVDSYI
jgi:hypothetical protein